MSHPIHPGSSSSSAIEAEDISDLTKKMKMMTTLPDVVWVLKISGSVTLNDSTSHRLEQFFGGVCIASKGLILTTSQGITPIWVEREVQHVKFDSEVVGRPRDRASFKKLTLIWKDSDSQLQIFRVKDDTERESYPYVDVFDVFDGDNIVNSDLVGIGVMGDQPFSRFVSYAPGPVASYYDTNYLTVYGRCFVVASNIFDDAIVATTMAGSPIFNGKSEALVGIIAFGIGGYCLAIPINERVIEQLTKKKKKKKEKKKKERVEVKSAP
jgi:hypothetical protein